MLTNLGNKILAFYKETEFSPLPGLKEAATIFFWWSLPAFTFVVFVQWISIYRSVEYLCEAISQGVGPNLWNVIGVFGFFLFGMAILFPGIQYLSFAANRVLINVYAIGSLMFGLLLGQFVSDFSNASLERWQFWLFGVSFIVLFVMVLALNFATWYLSYLIYTPKGKTSFVTNVERLGGWWRTCIGVTIMIFPLYLMLAER